MSSAPGSESHASGAGATPRSSWETLLPILGAIGAGVGVLGFVTFFGGAVVWARADKADLPALDIVAAVPNSMLLATGAHFLLPALLVALLVAFALLAVYAYMRLLWLPATSGRAESALRRAAAAAADAQVAEERARTSWETVRDAVPEDQEAVRVHRERWLEQRQAAEDAQRELDGAEREMAASSERGPRGKVRAGVELGLIALLLAWLVAESDPVVPWAIVADSDPVKGWDLIFEGSDLRQLVLKVFVWFVVALLVAVTYRHTDRIALAALVALVLSAVIVGGSAYIEVRSDLRIEPLAALRRGRAPVVGVYVADSGGQLYVATFRHRRGAHSRLWAIPRDQITELAIGPRLRPDDAKRRALAMALALCRRGGIEVGEGLRGTWVEGVDESCTTARVGRLRAQLTSLREGPAFGRPAS